MSESRVETNCSKARGHAVANGPRPQKRAMQRRGTCTAWATSTSPKNGRSPAYAELVMDQTGEVIERGPDTDSLMSAGDTVEPIHYAPFLAALKSITGSEDWSL